jgi:hypothetical protein
MLRSGSEGEGECEGEGPHNSSRKAGPIAQSLDMARATFVVVVA